MAEPIIYYDGLQFPVPISQIVCCTLTFAFGGKRPEILAWAQSYEEFYGTVPHLWTGQHSRPMYGDLGYKLVQHAKRTQALTHLPPYQVEIVRALTREVRDLDKDASNIRAPFSGSFNLSAEPAIACSFLVNHLCMRRNKRCLLAYHRVRSGKLEAMCWSGKDVLDIEQQEGGRQGNGEGFGMASEAGNQSSLSPEEEEYVRQYGDMLAAYKGQWTDIDLTGSLEPPKDLFIDVRVLKDAGEIQTEYGAITLTKNSQFYVRQGDVERLIAQGYLQKLST